MHSFADLVAYNATTSATFNPWTFVPTILYMHAKLHSKSLTDTPLRVHRSFNSRTEVMTADPLTICWCFDCRVFDVAGDGFDPSAIIAPPNVAGLVLAGVLLRRRSKPYTCKICKTQSSFSLQKLEHLRMSESPGMLSTCKPC